MKKKNFNMISRVILLFFITGLLGLKSLFAQDYHLSQYDMAYQYTNPALTGVYLNKNAEYKIAGTYRSQWWQGLGGAGFSTAFLSFDKKLKDNFGVGGYIINNRASNNNFNNFHFLVSGAYKLQIDQSRKHRLSFGLQAGMMVKSFDPSEHTFENQFSPSSQGNFDRSKSSGENFRRTSKLNFDVNTGVYYRYYNYAKFANPFIGVSVFHLNHPSESFYDDVNRRLPLRYTIYTGSVLYINNNFSLKPNILAMYQGKITEVNPGLMVSYKISNTKFTPMAGINYRINDAAIFQLGLKQGQNIYKVSYDINTSYISNITNVGGLEFSVIYTGM